MCVYLNKDLCRLEKHLYVRVCVLGSYVNSWIEFLFKESYCIESRQSDMNRLEKGGDE